MADAPRFSRIDETTIGDHAHLSLADECYYLFEYISRLGFRGGATNSLISNLKKKPSQSAAPGYRYKGQAIQQCGGYLRGAINADWLRAATLVPVPPSKIIGHPDYDDRIVRICQAIGPGLDIREIVRQVKSTDAAHEQEDGLRPTVQDLVQNYIVDQSKLTPAPKAIAIVDDVLTAGTHFVAVRQVLRAVLPGVPIVGIFIARRVFPPANFDLDVTDAL